MFEFTGKAAMEIGSPADITLDIRQLIARIGDSSNPLAPVNKNILRTILDSTGLSLSGVLRLEARNGEYQVISNYTGEALSSFSRSGEAFGSILTAVETMQSMRYYHFLKTYSEDWTKSGKTICVFSIKRRSKKNKHAADTGNSRSGWSNGSEFTRSWSWRIVS